MALPLDVQVRELRKELSAVKRTLHCLENKLHATKIGDTPAGISSSTGSALGLPAVAAASASMSASTASAPTCHGCAALHAKMNAISDAVAVLLGEAQRELSSNPLQSASPLQDAAPTSELPAFTLEAPSCANLELDADGDSTSSSTDDESAIVPRSRPVVVDVGGATGATAPVSTTSAFCWSSNGSYKAFMFHAPPQPRWMREVGARSRSASFAASFGHTVQSCAQSPAAPSLGHSSGYARRDAAGIFKTPRSFTLGKPASSRAVFGDIVRKRRAAAAAKRHAESLQQQQASQTRAISERHPVIVVLDVLFCFASVVACATAMGQIHTQSGDFFGPGSATFPVLLAANAAVSAVSLAWIASRFFLAQRDGWEVVDDLARVRARYVRSWFAFDLVFALPLEYAFFGWQWELFAFAQLRHFLRVARIVNLGSSQHPLLASRLWFRFMSFCFLAALLVLGIAAAFWALQAQHTYEESVYWALATVTSVGYGDVVATDGPSRVYSCFAMFAGVALLSTMTAYATSFLATKNRLEQERETQTQTLHAMLEHYDVPWDVQKEVIGAVPSMLERSNRVAFDRLLERLPGFVAEKVGGYVAAKALLRVPAFASLPREHVLRVARVAEPELRAPDEVVAEEGQRADAAWFVVHGTVRLMASALDTSAAGQSQSDGYDGRIVDLGAVGPGESFGGLDPDDADAVHAATAVCASACELVALTRGALEELRTADTETYDAVSQLLGPVQQRRLQAISVAPPQAPGTSPAERHIPPAALVPAP